MNFQFLGTADSAGIPSHNCYCQICEEHRKQNKVNLATSAYIECDNKEIILLDAGIENIATIFDGKAIKAIFLTHFHPDHALGLLRLRYSKDKIPCYHPKDEVGFSDLFKHKQAISYITNNPFEKIMVNEIGFTPLPLKHSKNTTGYLIEMKGKTIAYLTDCNGIEENVLKFLMDSSIDECYLDACLTPEYKRGNHLNYDQATILLDKIGAKKSYFFHASHSTLQYIKDHDVKLKYEYISI